MTPYCGVYRVEWFTSWHWQYCGYCQVWTVSNVVLRHHVWQDILQCISFRFSYELCISLLFLFWHVRGFSPLSFTIKQWSSCLSVKYIRQRTNEQIILVCVYVCVCKMFAGAGDSAFFHKDPQVCLSVSLSVCLPVCLCVESILSIHYCHCNLNVSVTLCCCHLLHALLNDQQSLIWLLIRCQLPSPAKAIITCHIQDIT